MALSTQPYKGTRDFYPEDMRIQRWMFNRMREVVERYGYREYDGPMLEPFELYAAKTGEEIVNQQLYWLMDRGERKLAIRPEMTPTLARMVAAKFHELPRPVRWFSTPNLWRYERPQRGRLREHWQLNVDVLGGDPLLADAEILSLALDVLRGFGGEKHVSIRVNNRRLMDHLFREKMGLNAETALQVTKALDARAKVGEEAYAKWLGDLGVDSQKRDVMERFFQSGFEETAKNLPCEGVTELRSLFELLEQSGAAGSVQFDPTVLRGLDYYTGTVFEMYDTSPDNRRAIFGGGRYDNLLALFGNYKLSGVGFGMGDVTLRNFLETHQLLPSFGSAVDVFVSLPRPELRLHAEKVAQSCRSLGLRVITPLSSEGFGAQLKQASKHGARFAVLFGDTEIAQGQAMLKDLSTGEQVTVGLAELAPRIHQVIKGT
ncbi:MAG: histidine--tRNA ligase [Bdellovibrionales bacterium GWB1_55_8]|nr:MAG: histidine--tRNA ligase [Bdellovibrionales bacterium GWB1_55_8]